MKLSNIFLYFLPLLSCVAFCNKDKDSSTFNLQHHMSMVMKFRSKTRTMLENLYISANRVEKIHTIKSNVKRVKKSSRRIKNKNLFEMESRSKAQRTTHFSNISRLMSTKFKLKAIDYLQYRYKNYDEITKQLYDLERKYPEYLKVTTAQKLYKLPHPGGFCNFEKKTLCEHHIVFLTNHKVKNEGKHQIYISGEVHGDERVGPTATLELIELFLENKDNPWFKFLLESRYIVITPMTNPHGYYDKVREELLINDEDKVVLTRRMYAKTHKDINRDFPYLVNPQSCMETIGARVVNELYLHHLFSLALSLHGGTESLSYPYGTPNHMRTKHVPKFNYIKSNEKLAVDLNNQNNVNLLNKFRSGEYDNKTSKSTNPPDYNALSSIATTASDHTSNNNHRKYKTGDMNGEVYSVTGGMEDWAYSGSWEGAPIITQPCQPTTYNGYSEKKTKYDNFHKDSLKSIMFLLEVSHEKVPEQKNLGRKNIDCLINLRSNAFFNKITENQKVCLDENIDGYIPRIIRISLTLIDILHPYVTFITQKEGENLKIIWTVGGAIDVDSTYILFQYFDAKPSDETIKMLSSTYDLKEIKNILKQSTKDMKGKAVWNTQYTADDRFKVIMNTPSKNGKYLVFLIVAMVDKNWSIKNHPDPDINPQTHIANLRTSSTYKASNGKFTLKGQDFFKSNVSVTDTSKLE